MSRKKTTTAYMVFPIDFNPKRTDADSLASGLDRLMDTAMSTPGILDDYGEVRTCGFFPVDPEDIEHLHTIALGPITQPQRDALENILDRLGVPPTQVAVKTNKTATPAEVIAAMATSVGMWRDYYESRTDSVTAQEDAGQVDAYGHVATTLQSLAEKLARGDVKGAFAEATKFGKNAPEEDDEEEGDDVCDLCHTAGVNVDRTTYCGKTIGVECGCEESHKDGTCGDPDCEDCRDHICILCDGELEEGNGDNWKGACPGCADRISNYMDQHHLSDDDHGFDAAVEALKAEDQRNNVTAQCQSCSWSGDVDECKPIKDIHERVAPGEPMPYGECPRCGALCHPQEDSHTKHMRDQHEEGQQGPDEEC